MSPGCVCLIPSHPATLSSHPKPTPPPRHPRDEGVAYFEAVAAAGVDAVWREFEHGYHAFPLFPFGKARGEALAFIYDRLQS